MKKFRRVLLLVVCLAAMMALSAVTASAAGSETQTDTSVAKAGDLYYDTLEDAFASIETEGTVELVADVEVNNVVINIMPNKTITLALGDHKITVPETFNKAMLFRNYGTFTIKGDANGTIDGSVMTMFPVIENTYSGASKGALIIESGTIISNFRAIRAVSGTVDITGGDIQSTSDSASSSVILLAKDTIGTIGGDAKITGGNYAVELSGAELTISENAYINGAFGVVLSNSPGENKDSATHSKLTMTGGTIEASTGFALAGNNTQSALCEAEIKGGSLKNTTGETCIYWPMEGILTVGGDATVEGGTGIEAKMGTINIKDNAKITGTGDLLEDKPYNGGSQAEGSAILTSAQMYGASAGQYIKSPDLKVNITGGTLTSQQGNAVTVYNAEDTEAQKADVTVTGGELKAADGMAGVKVTMAKGKNTAKIEEDGDTTTFNTSGSQTTVKVAADVAAAAVDQNGKTSYYKDVNDALAANADGAGTAGNPVNIYILDDAEISREALESENVKLTTAADVELKVSSNVEGMIVKETANADGSTTYELVDAEQLAAPKVEVTAEPVSESAHEGEFILLKAQATHDDIDVTYSYEWYKDGKLLDGQVGETLDAKESGDYTVKVTAHKRQADGSVLNAECESDPVTCTIVPHDYEWKYDETNHWQECAICDGKSGTAAHTFGKWKVTAEPTADKQGSREKSCTVCGYTLTEAIPATGSAQGGQSGNGGSAQTGDDFNALPLIALMGIAGAAAAGTVVYGRRKKNG